MTSPVAVIVGTRPEAIKLSPLILELRRRGRDVAVCATSQHRELARRALDCFGIEPDHDLGLMHHNQTPSAFASRCLAALDVLFAQIRPQVAVVQGDTTTTFAAALAAFYAGIPVCHVEAGLRTSTPNKPFPEEMHRRLITRLAERHYAPTERAAANLRQEGVANHQIVVTGNTGIDAMLQIEPSSGDISSALAAHDELVLVTTHRREAHGEPMRNVCTAIASLAERFPRIAFGCMLHPNPNARRCLEGLLPRYPNILLIEPLDYPQFVDLMKRSAVIISDSGGIQEEAPYLGKFVFVLRDETDRPEGIQAAAAVSVGLNPNRICSVVGEFLCLPEDRRPRPASHPFGDGQASRRIADDIDASFPPL